jgi:hypothetical protein
MALVLGAAMANGPLVLAHHSFAAIYADRSKTIQGVVVQFQFRDPHSFIQVSVRTPEGLEMRYEVEWRGAVQLTRQGVTRLTVKAGDYLVITGNPSRNQQDHWLRASSLRRPRDGFAWNEEPYTPTGPPFQGTTFAP